MNQYFLDQLICPAGGGALSVNGGEFVSDTAKYPIVEGIPWLFRDPQRALADWSARIRDHLEVEKLYLKHIQHGLNASKNPLRNKRLSRQHEARSRNLALMQKTLAGFVDQEAGKPVPSSQQIYSYFQLFFRDWCWETEELDVYESFVSDHIDSQHRSVLVLGSGAGGLSYRLARRFPDKNFVSLEHNPFLAITADRIMQGKSVKLHDYSAYPTSLEKTSQKWEIKADKLEHDNHQSVMSAFPDLPFSEGAFDVVVAPWFLDILDMPIAKALSRAAHYVGSEGRMLFFGPANIHKPRESEQLCREEIEALFDDQFGATVISQSEVVYLQSPLDSQTRVESVLFICADKKTSLAVSSNDDNSGRRIQFTPELERYKIENDTFHKILSHINRDMSYQELATILENEYGFSSDESLYYAETFIRKIELAIYS